MTRIATEAPLQSSPPASQPAQAALRRFPYPYAAMLAICSDLDETPNRGVYVESSRFLNTSEITSMGAGVGLEVGNTIYFDMAPDQFAYWNTDDRGREIVRALIHSGHIDCLHSFGDLADTRAHAARALEELARHACRLDVWIDHATAPTNFGADIMRGSGDVPGSRAYHADLTCAFGVRYVWRGRVTSMIGQEVDGALAGIFDPRHPYRSAVTTAKEWAKVRLGRRDGAKYGPHAGNHVTFAGTLRDGHPVVEFLRSNPHFNGPSGGDTADGLPGVLTDRFLGRLVARRGCCVLYTHLGKIADRREPFGSRTRAAFRRLAERSAAGDILVTTTRRLLAYIETTRALGASVETHGDLETIRVTCPGVTVTGRGIPLELQGLTFFTSRPLRTALILNGADVTAHLRPNPPDESGRMTVSLPWTRLEFPSGI